MAYEKILVIEDEEDISKLIVYNLKNSGFNVWAELTGENGLKRAKELKPDLILLDLMLPKMDGLDLCRFLKSNEQYSNIPVIMITAKGSENDIVKGLECGAEDYITKPFSPKVLIARIKAVLRRMNENSNEEVMLSFRELSIHKGKREVRIGDSRVKLTNSEFQILWLFISKPGWVFTRDQIVDKIRGPGYAITDRSIDVQIVGLRKKLGALGKLIETIHGVGYRFFEET